MSNYQGHNHNLSEQFKNAVHDAITHGNYEELNTLVTDTVTDVVANTGKQVKKMTDQFQNNIPNTASSIFTPPKKKLLPETKKVGQVSSILCIAFGSIGAGMIGITLLISLLFSAMEFISSPTVFIIQLILFVICALVAVKGISDRGRLSRMKRYISLCAGNMYVNIRDLATQTNKTTDYVLKDVKKMLKLGFFPQGHLDEQGTCLMLDDVTYQEYLKIDQERKAIAEEEAKKEARKAALKKKTSQNKELQLMVQEGMEYIEQLHEMNELLPGEIISNKLDRMEHLLKEIFEQLEEDPSQMPKMQKLMNYYLPTTIKLLEAYKNFDDVSTPGNDIIKAKAEIEKTVDTINEAFAELLNKLFQSTVFDVTTDAQVLQTMLAKEGLTKNKFSEDKR